MSEFRLDGEIALVTGGGTGLGLAIARCMADVGARVVVVGRRGAVFNGIGDLNEPGLRRRAAALQAELERSHGDTDAGIRDLLTRYI